MAAAEASNQILVKNMNMDPALMVKLQAALTPRMTKYIPHIPTVKQTAFLLLGNREAFYGGAAGGGKKISLTTPIYTLKGWTTLENVHPGDVLYDKDGQQTVVLAESPVDAPKAYKVVLDDDTEIEACADHRWTVATHVDATRNKGRLRVMTTQEMVNAGLFVKQGAGPPISKFRIPVAKPLQCEYKELPIHPYLLGYWLGDGTRDTGVITTTDTEVLQYIHQLGYSSHIAYVSSTMQYRIDGLTTKLREIGLLGKDKHIPEMYLQASFEQRLELLRGLMDSDGTIEERGVACFCSTEKSLIRDVAFLIRSLGYKHGVSHVKPSEVTKRQCNYSANLYEVEYRLTFTPMPEFPVFRLPRKKARLNKEQNSRNDWYFIKAIEPIEPVPMKCLTVDSPSHTFLVGRELIPTHNSDALLMGALQYVDQPNYSAILFRRTYADLALPGALMDRAESWLAPFLNTKEVRWVEKEKTYEFPSGATLTFGYLENAKDKYRYQSSEFQYIGFDELTHFREADYRYLFSRLRRLKGVPIPLRMRSASNPGGEGHDWVLRRFILEGLAKKRIFIPATLQDNPHLDIEEYMASLMELDPITRAQLMEGNWTVRHEGAMFQRDWFTLVEPHQLPRYMHKIRYWDFAATEPSKTNKDPDWTAGVLMGEYKGVYYVLDVQRFQVKPHETDRRVALTAKEDGYSTDIWIEQEPGSAGIKVVDHYARGPLKGYTVRGNRSTGSKILRANPFSVAAGQGRVYVVRAAWNNEYFDELELFPNATHDDQVDSSSGAYEKLSRRPSYLAVPSEVTTGGSYWSEGGWSNYGY